MKLFPGKSIFLIDEASDCVKGANAVISMLHYFFDHHSLGEQEVYLHADNCSGQNQNSAVMQCLMWRVLSGRHNEITISFLVVGHTKFAPDWCFGLLKRLYRRSRVGSIRKRGVLAWLWQAECNLCITNSRQVSRT